MRFRSNLHIHSFLLNISPITRTSAIKSPAMTSIPTEIRARRMRLTSCCSSYSILYHKDKHLLGSYLCVLHQRRRLTTTRARTRGRAAVDRQASSIRRAEATALLARGENLGSLQGGLLLAHNTIVGIGILIHLVVIAIEDRGALTKRQIGRIIDGGRHLSVGSYEVIQEGPGCQVYSAVRSSFPVEPVHPPARTMQV